jgi:hypothetical protein
MLYVATVDINSLRTRVIWYICNTAFHFTFKVAILVAVLGILFFVCGTVAKLVSKIPPTNYVQDFFGGMLAIATAILLTFDVVVMSFLLNIRAAYTVRLLKLSSAIELYEGYVGDTGSELLWAACLTVMFMFMLIYTSNVKCLPEQAIPRQEGDKSND